MNREQAALTIKGNIEDYLQRQGIDTGKPFTCYNPAHLDKHPSMSLDRERQKAHCFSCGADYSALDLIGIDYNLTDYNEMLKKGAELYNLDIDGTESEQRKNAGEQQAKAEPEPDYTAFYSEAAKNLYKTDYHTRRGISQATAEYFKLGYVEKWKHPKAPPSVPASPRLIIPIGKGCYIARDTRPNPPKSKDNKSYTKLKVGSPVLFNLEALRTASEPVFIAEGEIDAMSIYEAGGIAVALGSTAYKNKLYQALEQNPTKQPLILTLDNDNAGKLCSKEILSHLKGKGFNICKLNVQRPYHDANEALQANRELLIKQVARYKELAETSTDLAQQIQYEENNQASSYIETMRRELEAEREQPIISTGFKNIDNIINGGLYPGLYFIGAVSSLGKTTLALQIADNVAQQGHDALIISLEMAKRELIAKSISRETAIYSLKADGDIKKLGRTTAEIMSLKLQQGYYKAGTWHEHTEQKKKEIAAVVDIAFKNYSNYAQHIFIYEGIGDITPEAIKARVEEHRAIYGKAPVVIVDYLQIMAGESDRLSDKQKADKGVVELKRLSRDYKTPVIAISSLNRESYNKPIDMDSFKESGGIEYSSDILIGLQYKGMNYQTAPNGKKEGDAERLQRLSELYQKMREAAQEGRPQHIEVKILKNRNGSRGTAELNFYPMFNYFTEGAKEPEQAANRRVL